MRHCDGGDELKIQRLFPFTASHSTTPITPECQGGIDGSRSSSRRPFSALHTIRAADNRFRCYLFPIDTGPAFCPNSSSPRAAEVESRLRHAHYGVGTSRIKAGGGHNAPHRVLEFPDALFDSGASWKLCAAAMN
jgi:hypothetical protein